MFCDFYVLKCFTKWDVYMVNFLPVVIVHVRNILYDVSFIVKCYVSYRYILTCTLSNVDVL
jgi:hypothetical protein